MNAQYASIEGVARPGFSFPPSALIRALTAACLVYSMFLLIAILMALDESLTAPALSLLHFGGAASCLVYWRFGRWGSARYDSFGAALLLAAAIFRVHAALDTFAYGLRLEDIPSTVPIAEPVAWLLFKGESITQIGILLIVSVWRATIGNKIERFSFLEEGSQIPLRLLTAVYVAGLAANMVTQMAPGAFGVLQQFASQMFVFAVASIYFIAVRGASRARRVAVAFVLALPMVTLALGTGVKESLLFPLVPAALAFWFGYRAFVARLLAVVLGFLALAISQLYVGYVRETAWIKNQEAPVLETLSSFGSDLQFLDLHDGLEQISSRINMTSAHAITVSLADSYGYEPIEVFGLIPASFVPRMVWPNKPVLQPGAMHTARIRGVDADLSTITSATAPGFSAELYLGAGYFGVFLGAGLYGLLLAVAQLWVFRVAPGFGHRAFALIAMYSALRFDEKAVVYAYTSVFFAVVFIWLLKRISTAFGFRMQTTSAVRRRA